MWTKCSVVILSLLLSGLAEEQSNWNGGSLEPSTGNFVSDAAIGTNDTETDANVDQIVDTILNSGRQGRTLDGFDEVYTDPSVHDALQKGDDAEARNIIRDKLCSLGLMNCVVQGKRPYPPPPFAYQRPPSNGPYGPPRPMSPLGNNNKYTGPPRKVGYAYGSQSSYPGTVYGSKPPGPIYTGDKPLGPYYEGPSPPGPIYLGNKPQIFEGSNPPGPIFEDNSPPYKFVSNTKGFEEKYELDSHGLPKPTIVVNSQGGAGQATANSVNIHHHYHHIDQEPGQGPGVVVKPIAPVVPVAPAAPINTGSSFISGAEYSTNSFGTGGFNPINLYEIDKYKQTSSGLSSSTGTGLYNGVNSGVGPVNGFSGNNVYSTPVKQIFEPSNSLTSNGPSGFSGSSVNTQYGQGGSGIFKGNSGSFHSSNPDYYKKALNSNGALPNYLQTYSQSKYTPQFQGQFSNSQGAANQFSQSGQFGSQSIASQTAGQYNTGESYQGLGSSYQNSDCICVPYEQCPSYDVIGRKGDLILPLDPRHLDSEIQAVDDEAQITDKNGTVTVVRLPKSTKNESIDENSKDVDDNSKKDDKPKSIQKRDVSEKKSDDLEKAEGEGRFIGLGGIGGGINGGVGVYGGGIGAKRVIPTFGVSFGLPIAGGGFGGYPVNPFGVYPAPNPYFGSINPNGLNLGLVNVNPLLSLQVAKNEYGEKLIKPLVNLHVTPNANIVETITHYLKAKKFGSGPTFNKHFHTHTHIGNPPEIYHPNYHHSPEIHPYAAHELDTGSFPPSSPGIDNVQPHGPPGSYSIKPVSNYEINNPSSFAQLDGRPYYDNPQFHSFKPGPGYGLNRENFNYSPLQYQDFYPQNQQLQTNEPSNAYANNFRNYNEDIDSQVDINAPATDRNSKSVKFPTSRRRRNADMLNNSSAITGNEFKLLDKRQAFYQQNCGPRQVCCRRPSRQTFVPGQCGRRNTQGITGRIKNPVYVDGDSEFGEYPWQVAILKKDPKESVYVCGGTLIDPLHVLTAVHCIKAYSAYDLRVRLGEWDVNHDVEFFPYIERDVSSITVHPEYYAGTLDNDIAILSFTAPVDFTNTPHISPACLPDKYSDFTGSRCWTTGWGKDAFGDSGKYQNILKEVDVPIIGAQQCQQQLRNTRLGYSYVLNPGFICAGGEEGKDACKGDGGGPLVCERNGIWQLVGIVSWGIGCGQVNVPGVYVRVSHYLDWIQQVTQHKY